MWPEAPAIYVDLGSPPESFMPVAGLFVAEGPVEARGLLGKDTPFVYASLVDYFVRLFFRTR